MLEKYIFPGYNLVFRCKLILFQHAFFHVNESIFDDFLPKTYSQYSDNSW